MIGALGELVYWDALAFAVECDDCVCCLATLYHDFRGIVSNFSVSGLIK